MPWRALRWPGEVYVEEVGEEGLVVEQKLVGALDCAQDVDVTWGVGACGGVPLGWCGSSSVAVALLRHGD